jgi:hypothetical protein
LSSLVKMSPCGEHLSFSKAAETSKTGPQATPDADSLR